MQEYLGQDIVTWSENSNIPYFQYIAEKFTQLERNDEVMQLLKTDEHTQLELLDLVLHVN